MPEQSASAPEASDEQFHAWCDRPLQGAPLHNRLRRGLVLSAIFLVVAGTHALSPVRTSTDSMWSIPTALSIWNDGNCSLNKYVSLQKEFDRFAIISVNGKDYTFFPLATSLFAVPVVAVSQLWMTPQRILDTRRDLEKIKRR